MKFRAFWDVAPCSLGVDCRFISLMMGAVNASETSVYSDKTTRRYIPEVSNLHTGRMFGIHRRYAHKTLVGKCHETFVFIFPLTDMRLTLK
jgi:hypothetical protein